MSTSSETPKSERDKYIGTTPNAHFITGENVNFYGGHRCYCYKTPKVDVGHPDRHPGRPLLRMPKGECDYFVWQDEWLARQSIDIHQKIHDVNTALDDLKKEIREQVTAVKQIYEETSTVTIELMERLADYIILYKI